jgi:hypothetical protein
VQTSEVELPPGINVREGICGALAITRDEVKGSFNGVCPSLTFNVVLCFGDRLCFRLQVKERTQYGGPMRMTCSHYGTPQVTKLVKIRTLDHFLSTGSNRNVVSTRGIDLTPVNGNRSFCGIHQV